MSIEQTLQMIFERFSAFQTLWNLYLSVALGMIGFIAAARQAMRSKWLRIVLILGFVAFASVNLLALLDVAEQRRLLIEVAGKTPEAKANEAIQALLNKGNPSDKHCLIAFHLAADVVVIVLIWFVPGFRDDM